MTDRHSYSLHLPVTEKENMLEKHEVTEINKH